MEIETPITPEECIGKEPTILDLQNIVNLHKKLFEDIDTSVLTFYINNYTSDSPRTDYYLGGHLLTSLYAPITDSLLNKVKDMDRKRKIEYGEPCNSLEKNSVMLHNKLFGNLQSIIHMYYSYKMHSVYRPPYSSNIEGDKGGEIYQQIEKTTKIGK